MNICSNRYIGSAALLLMGSLAAIYAEEPARSRGAAVVFSAPKGDTVSTNLNELRTPISPFQDLESNLKRPFEGLEKPRLGPDFREARKAVQQNQTLNKKTLKDSLNERAEQMFLNPEQFEGEKGDEAFFQLNKDSLDPYKKKPKNSLERYNNDRQDRLALTNQAASKNLFGEKNIGRPEDWKSDSKSPKPFKTGGYTDADRNDSLSLFSRAATNSNSLSTDRSASARSEVFNRSMENPIARHHTDADTRMEDFKRLLEGPRYNPPSTTARSSFATPAANYGAATPGNNTSARAGNPSAPTSEWSSFKSTSKAETKDDFATSAGLVGRLEKPQTLPEFPSATKSLSTPPPIPTPAPVKKFPNTTFKIPQRRI